MSESIDVELTTEAREQALLLLANSSIATPTLCLMKGRASYDTEDRWRWGIYGPDNISQVTSDLARVGYGLLYDFAGFKVAIPQPQLLPELLGKTLQVGRHGLIVVNRDGA